MGCVCAEAMQKSIANLQKVPMAELAGSVPQGMAPAPLGMATAGMSALGASLASGAGSASGAASGKAAASGAAMAQLAGDAKMSASVTPAAVAQLEGYVQDCATLGVNPTAANASAQMTQAAQSMNLHLPPAMGALTPLIGPHAGAFSTMGAMLSAASAAQSALGLDLTQPGSAQALKVKLKASMAASASGSAKASAKASMAAKASMRAKASAKLAANLGAHVKLVALAGSLGVNLLTAAGQAVLAQMLQAAQAAPVPKLQLDGAQAGQLGGSLAQVNAVQQVAGTSLLKGGGMAAVAAMMGNLGAACSVLLSSGVSALAAGSVQASGAANASIAGSAVATQTATLQETAAANFSGLTLTPPPKLGMLPVAANLPKQLGAQTVQGTPCASCPSSSLA